ncbi:hypothetical protein H0E87_016955 [Populus deltoides]|uniref:Geranylgeranyl diphosphate reductase, chloroplastic n=1 Tax=Populus deltoides TaxID=3696 RepID=A0A8T2XYF8_POPDE|nr:hypothetical protein H0E87_016955 [Populus deltoides]
MRVFRPYLTALPLKTIKQHQQPKPKILTITATSSSPLSGRKLRAAVIGGGPAGSSAAEALAAGGVETFLFERSPSTAKPCGGAIPLCMIDEFSIPLHLIDRHVTRMKIISPSNLTVDFGSKTLKSHEFIPMLRREVLDSFLRSRAQSNGAQLITGLVTDIEVPDFLSSKPYVIHHTINNCKRSLAVDLIVGADGANSRVAKIINAGNYRCAIAFQERIKLPDEKMACYHNLAEMYVGNDVSPDFYAWVFPKCDHVAVGTGTACARRDIKVCQRGIRERVKEKIKGGRVIKVEAHPIPEQPRPRRVRGRVALVGDAAGFLDLLQRVFYGSNVGREALVLELCGDEYVQRMTFDSYLYKKMASGDRWDDVKLVLNTFGSFMRCKVTFLFFHGEEEGRVDVASLFQHLALEIRSN